MPKVRVLACTDRHISNPRIDVTVQFPFRKLDHPRFPEVFLLAATIVVPMAANERLAFIANQAELALGLAPARVGICVKTDNQTVDPSIGYADYDLPVAVICLVVSTLPHPLKSSVVWSFKNWKQNRVGKCAGLGHRIRPAKNGTPDEKLGFVLKMRFGQPAEGMHLGTTPALLEVVNIL